MDQDRSVESRGNEEKGHSSYGIFKLAERLLSLADGFFCSKTFGLLSILFCACCLAVDIYLCFSPALWMDTAYTSVIIEPSYAEMIGITAHDVHPPLYYLLAKFFTDIIQALLPGCSALVAMKLSSVLPFVPLLLVIYTVLRREWGWYVAGLSAIAMMCMPHLASQVTEARMYGWGMFFVSSCYIAAMLVVRRGTAAAWISFALSGLASAYTHTYACIAVMPLYLMLGWHSLKSSRADRWKWLASCALAVIGFLPWLIVLVHQTMNIQGNFWIKEPGLHTVVISIVMPLVSHRYSIPAAVGIALLVLYRLYRMRREACPAAKTWVAFGLGIYLFVSAVGIAISLISTPVFICRYAYPAYAPFWIGCCVLFLGAPRAARVGFILLALALAAINFLDHVKSKLEATEGALALISYFEQRPDTCIVTDAECLALPLNRYLGRTIFMYQPTVGVPTTVDLSAYLTYLRTPEELRALIERYPTVLYGESEPAPPVTDVIRQQGFTLTPITTGIPNLFYRLK